MRTNTYTYTDGRTEVSVRAKAEAEARERVKACVWGSCLGPPRRYRLVHVETWDGQVVGA